MEENSFDVSVEVVVYIVSFLYGMNYCCFDVLFILNRYKELVIEFRKLFFRNLFNFFIGVMDIL